MSRKLISGSAMALVVAAVAVAVGGWYVLLRDDSPPPVNLQDALVAAAGQTAATGETAEATAATAIAAGEALDPSAPGAWTLLADGRSFVGYRVQEELASIGATTAVGRTEAVAGTLLFDGAAITEVRVAADMTQLESGESRRDRALRRQAIETATFPTATFVLGPPIVLDAAPEEGLTLSAVVAGSLTLHGVTREVEIELEGQIADGRLVVIGSTEVEFANYDISAPTALAVLSVEERAVIEIQLVFERTA